MDIKVAELPGMSTNHDASDAAPRFGAFVTADGLRLFRKGWWPREAPRAAVLLVHGYGEYSGRYGHVGAYLSRQGYAVHTYDQRGFGRSDGRRGYVESVDAYLDDLGGMLNLVRAEHAAVPLILFGHSMGGAFSTLFAIERDDPPDALILSSPMLRLGEGTSPLLKPFAPLAGLLAPTLPTIRHRRGLSSRDPQVVEQKEADFFVYHGSVLARTGAEFLRATKRIARGMEAVTLPFLVFHGTHDQVTNVEGSRELYRRARSTDKTLHLYEGLYHETLNEPERELVLTDMAAWMRERL
jgi:alpha-beta hydrolase superfamily lysophospholipase